MTTIQIELPDATAQAARDAGLLTSQALERLLNDALRRKAVGELFEKMDELADVKREAGKRLLDAMRRLRAANVPPLTEEEIAAAIKAARAVLRASGETGR